MACSSQSFSPYDVFISFRGEDVRKTFVDHLHSALLREGIHAFKDDQMLPRGEPIALSLGTAIEESKISVVVFSKNYADSSWCLDELVHIMKCRAKKGQIVYPVFYDVDPSDVRKQKNEYGEAFDKWENTPIAQVWREALFYASNIAGWEVRKTANGHESICIKEIVDTIWNKLFSLENGLHSIRMPHANEDLEEMRTHSHYTDLIPENGLRGVRMPYVNEYQVERWTPWNYPESMLENGSPGEYPVEMRTHSHYLPENGSPGVRMPHANEDWVEIEMLLQRLHFTPRIKRINFL